MMRDEDLIFDSHLSIYRDFLTGNPEQDSYWHYEAQDTHVLCVSSSIGDLQSELVQAGQATRLELAHFHLVFGAARRAKFIWGALREIRSLIAPNRDHPLSIDAASEASRALNDIYIHSLGVMDNYAWALLHLFGDDEISTTHSNDVGLFSKRYRKIKSLQDIHDVTSAYDTWYWEIRSRRDPVAHRIPLSVPPSIQDDETMEDYRIAEARYWAAFHNQLDALRCRNTDDREKAERETEAAHNALQSIGKFAPFMVHDPNDGMTRIYPTVPEDVGTLVRLSRSLNHIILTRIGSA